MRGRGGGEGGLGTISSELLLWVSMARERRGEGRLETQATIPNTAPTLPHKLPKEPPSLTTATRTLSLGQGQSQESWDFSARLGQ